MKPASAGYKFNNMQEIKSHSSVLYNERMAILFYMTDMNSIQMNKTYAVSDVLHVRAIIKQIYKNIRMLIRYNPTARATLNLDTKDDGIYVTDVAFGVIDKMIEYCEITGYTTRQLYIIVEELNRLETLIKDVLQYFHYFIRPDFRQKPDVDVATEKYKELADGRTVEQLRALVGKNHNIDFESIGTSSVELPSISEEHVKVLDVNGEPVEDDDEEDDTDITAYDESLDGPRDEEDGPMEEEDGVKEQ